MGPQLSLSSSYFSRPKIDCAVSARSFLWLPLPSSSCSHHVESLGYVFPPRNLTTVSLWLVLFPIIHLNFSYRQHLQILLVLCDHDMSFLLSCEITISQSYQPSIVTISNRTFSERVQGRNTGEYRTTHTIDTDIDVEIGNPSSIGLYTF